MTKENEKYILAEKERQRALCNRDLGAYVDACTELGITPESEIFEALESGLSKHDEAQLRKYLRKVEKRIISRKKYSGLLAYHNAHKVNLEQPEEKDLVLMRRGLINILGYAKLNGVGGEKILTADAKPSRIIETYRSCIIRAKK